MTVAVNLAELPPPEIIESLDFEATLDAYKAKLLALYPEAINVIDLESEPMVKLLQLATWREMQLKAKYNDEARAMMLAYSKGSDLDHIAYTYYRREVRLVITEADLAAVPPVDEVLESDDDFRDRVSLKLESYSSAGPTEAFIFFARSADGQVKDASCISPEPGTSLITVLSRTGSGIPQQALLDTVDAALNVTTIRPLSEEVLVQAAEVIEYSLDIGLHIYNGPDSALIVAAAEAALVEYTNKSHKLGIAHTRAGWDKAAKQEGVWDVTLNTTGSIKPTKLQAAYCTSITTSIIEIST